MMQHKCFKQHLPALLTLSLLSIPAAIQAVTLPAKSNVSITEYSFANNPLSHSEKQWIGSKIYQNECASNPANLTYWGEGEEFPSFGIGHFIWYPSGVEGKFKETFPQMINYVSQFSKPPQWLLTLKPFKSPWQTKEAFDQAWSNVRLMELREWLLTTQAYQAEFIVEQSMTRFLAKLEKMSAKQATKQVAYVEKLLSFKEGRFAFVDYINFKGVGEPHEQYQGEAWGLNSVIQHIELEGADIQKVSNQKLLRAFVKSAKQRLALRTDLAPKERNEKRWLKGWFKRLDGYLLD